MEITVHTRHLDIPTALRESAVEKAQHLERFLEGTQKAEIVFSRDHAARDDGYVTCEISVVAHGRVVRVRSSGHLASTALETAIAKETQRLDADAGPSRATLTASSRRGEPATDRACGLKNLPSPDPPRAVIVGPTGTGKTALALDLARLAPERYELVSVDAMAVYRDLDIGTAKPTPAERAAAPWHLIDIVDPSEEFSVAAFQAEARRVLSGIDARGHLALLVGGTGLYHRAVVDGLEIPGRFPREAAELEQLADRPGGLAELFGRLSELDPVAASRVEPGNRRRIVRALEVTLGSGRPFSSFGPGLLSYRSTSSTVVGLELDRSELDRRLAERFEDQLARGFLDEVRASLQQAGRVVTHGSPGDRLPGAPQPRRGGRPLRTGKGRGGSPAASLCPPPGGLVQARPACGLDTGRSDRSR